MCFAAADGALSKVVRASAVALLAQKLRYALILDFLRDLFFGIQLVFPLFNWQRATF